MKKVMKAVCDHFSRPVQPLVDLLCKIPSITKIIVAGSVNEFERMLKAATGPKK